MSLAGLERWMPRGFGERSFVAFIRHFDLLNNPVAVEEDEFFTPEEIVALGEKVGMFMGGVTPRPPTHPPHVGPTRLDIAESIERDPAMVAELLDAPVTKAEFAGWIASGDGTLFIEFVMAERWRRLDLPQQHLLPPIPPPLRMVMESGRHIPDRKLAPGTVCGCRKCERTRKPPMPAVVVSSHGHVVRIGSEIQPLHPWPRAPEGGTGESPGPMATGHLKMSYNPQADF